MQRSTQSIPSETTIQHKQFSTLSFQKYLKTLALKPSTELENVKHPSQSLSILSRYIKFCASKHL